MPATVRTTATRSKFGNKITTYLGVKYHSKAEADMAMQLQISKNCGAIRDWERQVPLPLMVNDHHICTMIVDFRVTLRDGSAYFLEVKGVQTAKYKIQKKLLMALSPKIDYRVVRA